MASQSMTRADFCRSIADMATDEQPMDQGEIAAHAAHDAEIAKLMGEALHAIRRLHARAGLLAATMREKGELPPLRPTSRPPAAELQPLAATLEVMPPELAFIDGDGDEDPMAELDADPLTADSELPPSEEDSEEA